jgi:heme exporter protein A
MEGPRLSVNDLACRRGERMLFRGLSLALAPGEALQVVGANGTGKSSLLRIVAGLLRPYEGEVRHEGRVALLDDRLPLDEYLPLGKAFDFWSRIDGGGRPLESAGLAGLLDVPVRYLSTGQRKRAAILQSAPKAGALWLLDEPLNGLDEDGLVRLDALIDAHRKAGGAVLTASHRPLRGDWAELRLGA